MEYLHDLLFVSNGLVLKKLAALDSINPHLCQNLSSFFEFRNSTWILLHISKSPLETVGRELVHPLINTSTPTKAFLIK